MTFDLENVFGEVATQPCWLAWRSEKNGQRLRKRPMNASTSDPSSWVSLAEAQLIEKKTGVGLVLTDRDLCGRIVCVDLDGCRDPESGTIEAWADELIKQLDSYAEVSPSGTGVKVYLVGSETLPDKKRDVKATSLGGKKPAIELFGGTSARFVAVTGDHLDGSPMTLKRIDRDAWLRLLPEQTDERPDSDSFQAPMLEKLEDALRYVPADDRFVWERVTAALKLEADEGHLEAEDARALWDNWSKSAPDSYDERENAKVWNSFRRDEASEGSLVKKATIFKLAKDHGWPGFVVGSVGPVPLGRLRDGNFALLDQNANIIVACSADRLTKAAGLMGFAPLAYWRRQFPSEKGLFDVYQAADMIMSACNYRGAFNPQSVRGRGVWREGERVIENLSGDKPEGTEFRYLCFEPLAIDKAGTVNPAKVFEWIKLFNWRRPQDATLFFGWLAYGPVCGVVDWRPHVFLHGPPETGKTVLLSTATRLLTPLVVSADGSSTEAGIRQSLGPDSLPVIMDEFESDHEQRRLQNVIKLMRSASSADSTVLRGTPEGKAMRFELRSTFMFAAVNPLAGSAADDTRLVKVELAKHEGDRDVASRIEDGRQEFDVAGPAWCAQTISNAQFLPAAIDTFKSAMAGVGERHRKNMATLLAAAWVALNGREPRSDEAEKWVEDHSGVMELHGEAHSRDESAEALEHLLSHRERTTRVITEGAESRTIYEEQTLRAIIGQAYEAGTPVLEGTDIRVKHGWDGVDRGTGKNAASDDYLCLRVGSAFLNDIFASTKWSDWSTALRKLEGAVEPRDTQRFGRVGKQRALLIPVRHWWRGEDDEEQAPPAPF